jgi:phosphatidylserine decarboxylase
MDEIRFFDRYAQQERVEKIYGDGALRWTYGTAMGKLALAAVVKRGLFSRLYGWRMDRPKSRELIQPFIRDYELDPGEFALRPEQFRSFNEFFSRALVPEARPIDTDDDSAVFPADGRHLCVPDLSSCEGLFVKGQMFDLASLLEDDELTDRFAGGSLLLSRLCPVDYHRFHFPLAGRPGAARLINGPLYSVNPIALCQNIHILATNKRTVTELQTERFGTVLLIEVGATCVGSICQTYRPDQRMEKGQEKGYFRFGGSSTITIFQSGVIRFADDLVQQSGRHRELYARMGDVMGYRR